MNITDADGKWRIEYGQITNCKTGEVRRVTGIPSGRLAGMSYEQFMRECDIAFQNRKWPRSTCPACHGSGEIE